MTEEYKMAMRKFITLGISIFLASCACRTAERPQMVQTVPVEAVRTVPVEAVQTVPVEAACPYSQISVQVKTAVPACACVAPNPCRCIYRPDPCREVLRPRIHEVAAAKPRRNCPPDNQMINCGCGNCPTFRQPVIYQQFNGVSPQNASQRQNTNQMTYEIIGAASASPDFSKSGPDVVSVGTQKFIVVDETAPVTKVPAMPEAYVLASNRTAKRFLNDTAAVAKRHPHAKLYVKSAQSRSADLPAGVEKGVNHFKHQIENSAAFDLSETLAGSDYYLETAVDWLDTPSKKIPAIQYTVSLYDKNHHKVNQWAEVIKKADNSQSWI